MEHQNTQGNRFENELMGRMLRNRQARAKVEAKKKNKKIAPMKMRQKQLQYANYGKRKQKTTVQHGVGRKQFDEQRGKAEVHVRENAQTLELCRKQWCDGTGKKSVRVKKVGQ